MSQLDTLDHAQVVLLATLLVTEADLSRLQVLAAVRQDVLTQSLLYRLLLTYLPTDAHHTSALATFLGHQIQGFKDVNELDTTLDISAVQRLRPAEVRRQLHELRLDPLQPSWDDNATDTLGIFVRQWVYGIESVAGLSESILQLVDAVVEGRPDLEDWRDTYLVPTIRLSDTFYPERANAISVTAVEKLHGLPGVKTLLQFAEQDGAQAQVGRDLNEVVVPWVRGAIRAKRRRLADTPAPDEITSWQNINEWIHDTSRSQFGLAAKAVMEWDGPSDDDSSPGLVAPDSEQHLRLRYSQTVLALIYSSTSTGQVTINLLNQLLDRAAELWASQPVSESKVDLTTDSSRADLLHNALLHPGNSLTIPSHASLNFLESCIACQECLESFRLPMTVTSIADVALFSSEERQKQELSRMLQQLPQLTRETMNWPARRTQIHSLRTGGKLSMDTVYFLGRLSAEYVETELLDAMLTASQYGAVKELYLDSLEGPLSKEAILHRVVTAIWNAYDNASNGNRTRGGMKRAYDILNTFRPDFTTSTELTNIDHLIKATHSLSFYQLTLQHGVPFQPVNIRVNEDPLSLIAKVLDQNPKAYTKIDDLIEIGRNLVQAGLFPDPGPGQEDRTLEEQLFNATHRVTYLTVTAALSDHDFDTAYSYITSRLSTTPSKTTSRFTDDTSWRAAYAAGKYRPSTSPKSLHDRITSLSKRMDLLSVALTLAPSPEPLSEILATWRRSEEEMVNLRSQAVEEERAFEAQGSDVLPGGFGPEDRELDAAETRRMMERRALGGNGPTYEEEAPMGLFDVARGAASALRKTAFPLGGKGVGSDGFRIRDSLQKESSPRSSMDEQDLPGGEQRTRKRDMIANQFALGLGWALGATPATNPSRKDDEG